MPARLVMMDLHESGSRCKEYKRTDKKRHYKIGTVHNFNGTLVIFYSAIKYVLHISYFTEYLNSSNSHHINTCLSASPYCKLSALLWQWHCKGVAAALQRQCSDTAIKVQQYCKVMATWQSNSPPPHKPLAAALQETCSAAASGCMYKCARSGAMFLGINGCAAPATPLSSPPPCVWPKRSSHRCRPPGGCRRRKDGHSRAPLSAGAPLPDSCPA